MEIRISVIIPIYNAAATLRAAAESVLSQDVEGLELLLVDDGSTDGTAEVCHALAVQDARVQVIAQKNAGICAARNRGLQAACGTYIAFCDDDDEFLPGALAGLLQTALAQHADVVRGGYELLRQQADGTFALQPHAAGRACRLWQDGYADFLRSSGPQFVWNALYRRQALTGLFFDERCRYGLEDFIFNATLYSCTDRAVYLPQPVYRHFESAQSTSLCRSRQAFQGRLCALAPWMEAEYTALRQRCTRAERAALWPLRKAEAVTFLMHQLRDAGASDAQRRYAWQTLRTVLKGYPGHALDILRAARQNKKKTAALLLYQLRLQDLYDLLPGR